MALPCRSFPWHFFCSVISSKYEAHNPQILPRKFTKEESVLARTTCRLFTCEVSNYRLGDLDQGLCPPAVNAQSWSPWGALTPGTMCQEEQGQCPHTVGSSAFRLYILPKADSIIFLLPSSFILKGQVASLSPQGLKQPKTIQLNPTVLHREEPLTVCCILFHSLLLCSFDVGMIGTHYH